MQREQAKSGGFFRLIVGFACSILPSCDTLINRMAFFPDKLSNPVPLRTGEKNLHFWTEDSIRLHAVLLENPESDRLLLYFHGNAGHIVHRLEALREIRDMGLNVLGLSYRGYGLSQGRPTEKGVYLDGQTALTHAVEHLGFPLEGIFILGRSIGSAVAVEAAINKNLAGLVLITPISSAYDHARAHGFGPLASLAGDAFANAAKIARIKCPLLIVHGTKDEVLPFAMGRSLFEAAQCPKTFKAIKGGHHNNLEFVDPLGYWGAISQFLQTKPSQQD